MQVHLSAGQLGHTLGEGGPQRGDGMLRRLTGRGCGPGESAARAPQEVGSGPGPGRRAGQGANAAAGAPAGGRSLALGPLRAVGCWLRAQPLPPDPAPTAGRACGCRCAVNKASLPGRPLATEEGYPGRVPPRMRAAAAEGSGPCGLLLPVVGPACPKLAFRVPSSEGLARKEQGSGRD